MLFSIVVPVYNVENYLEECLKSIIKQVIDIDKGCEVILVDDGSTDTSGEICDKFGMQYSNYVKVFHNTNHGLLYTRRFGYKQTSGDYIVNCDSDDKLEDDALLKLQGIIEEYDRPDMVFFNHYLYKNGQRKIAFKDIFTTKKIYRPTKQEVIWQYMTGYKILSVCGAICKRTCIDINNDYRELGYLNSGEDSLQKIEQIDYAKTFLYLNESLYYYRIGSGMTGRYDPNYFSSFIGLFIEIEKRKSIWNIPDFERLMAIKTLSTAGRAITQSRYAKNLDKDEHIQYLKEIRENEFFKKYISYLDDIKKFLQRDYYFLLKILEKRYYKLTIWLLTIKNWMD